MSKRIMASSLSLLLLLSLVGCSFLGLNQPTTKRDSDSTIPSNTSSESTTGNTTGPSDATTDPSESQTSTTAPTTGETTPPQPIKQPEPGDEDFVKVIRCIPDIIIDLRYASENNFTSQQIYDFSDVWLRYGTVKKLMQVQEELKQNGYGLKIWDGFRPPSAQYKLWDICPDPTYVSNPNNGFSSHSRGNTVDITLVYTDGTELTMPTGFDDFSKLADRDYSDCSKEAADNAMFLEQLMIKHGFKPYSGEWWHFTDTQSYPVDEAFEPTEATLYYADCNEYISLRTKPSTGAEVIMKILAGEQVTEVAKTGDFALVEYQGLMGYVLLNYLKPNN